MFKYLIKVKFSLGMLYSTQGGVIKHLYDLPLLNIKCVSIFCVNSFMFWTRF